MFSYVALVAVIDEGFLSTFAFDFAFGILAIDEEISNLRRHSFFVTLWKPFVIFATEEGQNESEGARKENSDESAIKAKAI